MICNTYLNTSKEKKRKKIQLSAIAITALFLSFASTSLLANDHAEKESHKVKKHHDRQNGIEKDMHKEHEDKAENENEDEDHEGKDTNNKNEDHEDQED